MEGDRQIEWWRVFVWVEWWAEAWTAAKQFGLRDHPGWSGRMRLVGLRADY